MSDFDLVSVSLLNDISIYMVVVAPERVTNENSNTDIR